MTVNIQTLKDIRFYITKELEGIYHKQEISALANIIIKTVTGVSKLHELYMGAKVLTEEEAVKIANICKELKTGKPLQYIIGETVFYDCAIRVTGATLIPRPETEELVDIVIKENKDSRKKIIDIGTGSGCIAIALAANLPKSQITGIDISEDALIAAKENAKLNNVGIAFLKGDIFNFDVNSVEKADIIVSNPPYVRDSERQSMNKNVLDFEPHSSLFVPDKNPLIFYKAILKMAEEILRKDGRIYFEINEAMGKQMVKLLEKTGYSEIEIIPDTNCKDRIIKGTKNG
jgi:release factor glutamine methyltransferase